jgi:hypothetical protein
MTTEKKTSNRNSLKHGIFAEIVLSGEACRKTKQDYLMLLAGLRKAFRPANPFTKLLVEKLTMLYVRLSRLYKCDLQTAPILFSKVKESIEDNEPRVETEFIGAPKTYQVVVVPKGPSMELLLKYEGNLERQIARTLEQLKLTTGASEHSLDNKGNLGAHGQGSEK